MVDLMYCLINLLSFDFPWLYYVNRNSSIIFCLSSRDIYLYFDISVSPKLFCERNFFEDFYALVVLFSTLLPITLPVASALFWIALSRAVFNASVVDFLALSIYYNYYL